MNTILMTVWVLIPANVLALTGNDWLSMSKNEQSSYVAGAVDTWKIFVAFDSLPKDLTVVQMYRGLADCMTSRGMTYTQMTAIVKQYLEKNPNKWDNEVSISVWVAMLESCRI
jgi:hypothetical protein